MKNKASIIVRYMKYAAIGFITGAANGLFGSGGGTIAVPAMETLLGVEEHKAHATAISIILPLTVMSIFYYASNGHIDLLLSIKVVAGGLIGGYIGAKLLGKCPTSLLKKLFGIFMILAGIRMLIKA